MYNSAIQLKMFHEIFLGDPFFDSLRNSYYGFEGWFQKKSFQGEQAYVLEECGIQGFLYLKEEIGKDLEVVPALPEFRKLKVGTFKVNPHGTKLGERFIKIIFDQMLARDITFSYLTVYSEHQGLIGLLQEYGFYYWGKKGTEDVYVKDFTKTTGDAKKDYPLIDLNGNKKFLLSIKPEFHTNFFPDSRLCNEKNHYIEDLSHTNCIEKIFLSSAWDITKFSYRDIAIIYRTGDGVSPARFSAVATSFCTLLEVKPINSFFNIQEFLHFCGGKTIFNENELVKIWQNREYRYAVRLLYNLAFPRRITRGVLLDQVGISGGAIYALELTDEQVNKITNLSGSPKSIFK